MVGKRSRQYLLSDLETTRKCESFYDIHSKHINDDNVNIYDDDHDDDDDDDDDDEKAEVAYLTSALRRKSRRHSDHSYLILPTYIT